MIKFSDIPVGAGLIAVSLILFIMIGLGLIGVRIDWDAGKPVGFNLPWKQHVSINGQHVLSGHKVFRHTECGDLNDPCKIQLSDEAFSAVPQCFIQTHARDGTGYSETLVLKNVSTSELSFWKGNRANNGTTMRIDWVCVGK